MARRAEVRTIRAPIDKVWAGLLLFEDDKHPIRGAVGNPGDIGSRISYGQGDRVQTNQVLEAGYKHYVRYRCQFHGASRALHHMAFTDAMVEADYEIKAAQDEDVTYIRAVTEYQPPMWPTTIALMFAFLAGLGMNLPGSSNGWILGVLVSFWVAVGIVMQYLPRVFAYRFVTQPVLQRLRSQAESGSFAGSVEWRLPIEGMSETEVLDLRPDSKMTRAG